MSLIDLTLKHGRSLDEARTQLDTVVNQVRSTFGAMVHSTNWSPDRNAVKLAGNGFSIDMRIDAENVVVSGDIPFLGKLLASPVVAKLKGIVENTFQKKLTEKPNRT